MLFSKFLAVIGTSKYILYINVYIKRVERIHKQEVAKNQRQLMKDKYRKTCIKRIGNDRIYNWSDIQSTNNWPW